jgi:hypothetical protein
VSVRTAAADCCSSPLGSAGEKPRFLTQEDDVPLTPRSKAEWERTHPAVELGEHEAVPVEDGDDVDSDGPEERTTAPVDLMASDAGRALKALRERFQLDQFLEEHGLSRFEGGLREEGFEDAEALLSIEDEDLDTIGMKTGHRRLFYRALDALRSLFRSSGVPLDERGQVNRLHLVGDTGAVEGDVHRRPVDIAADDDDEYEHAVTVAERRGLSPKAILRSPTAKDVALGGMGTPPSKEKEIPFELVDEAERRRRNLMSAERSHSREERLSGGRTGLSRGGMDSRDGRRFGEANAELSNEIVLEVILQG